jgi:hypothetical protein
VNYRIVLTLACVMLTLQFALDASASVRLRLAVVALALTSFFLPESRGLGWQVSAILVQTTVCLSVLLRRLARG